MHTRIAKSRKNGRNEMVLFCLPSCLRKHNRHVFSSILCGISGRLLVQIWLPPLIESLRNLEKSNVYG